MRAAIVLGALVVSAAQRCEAACNIIPSASTTFRGALGSTDRPFAGPDELIELRVRPEVCDGASPGISDRLDDSVVTLVFAPPNGPANVLFVASRCADLPVQCPGAATTTCIDADAPGQPRVLQLLQRAGERRLVVRLPDTDAALGAVNDDRTFSGPLRIGIRDRRLAAANAASAAMCELVTLSCRDALPLAGAVACIDELFQLDGTCRTDDGRLDPNFAHLTALPPPNDYAALCTTPSSPCTGTATELRFTTDGAGNALIPMDWQGILLRQDDVPVPRLLRGDSGLAAFTAGLDLRIPGQSFLASLSPEGAPLPPVFVPQADASAVGQVSLFGSADAPHTVLRLARRSSSFQRCAGGANDGLPCAAPLDCPSGLCGPTVCCDAGTAACGATPCTADSGCPVGQECGPSLFDFRDRYSAQSGPVVLPRTGGMCSPPPDQICNAQLKDPVPLEGFAGTDDLFAFSQRESITGRDLNGDGDLNDTVTVLNDRASGDTLNIGAGGSEGRAVARVRQPPFSFPGVATEGEILAFIEPEPLQGDCSAVANCDKNGDGDAADTILRVYRQSGGVASDLLAGQDLALETALSVDGQVLALSAGRVFFREAEAGGSLRDTVRVSVASDGTQANDASGIASISPDGRFVTFWSAASNLVPGDTNACASVPAFNCVDLFLHDRDEDGDGVFDETGIGERRTVRISIAGDGAQSDSGTLSSSMSSDARFVSFSTAATTLVPLDTNATNDIFVHDRDADDDGIFDETGPLERSTTRVNLTPSGGQSAGSVLLNQLSADGRFVAFYSGGDDLIGDGIRSGVVVRDRDLDGDGLFDETGPGETKTTRVSVASDGTPADGDVGDGVAGDTLGFAMSSSGRHVAFAAISTNLAPLQPVAMFVKQVYVHDRDADGNGVFDENDAGRRRTSLVSFSTNTGLAGTANSFAPVVSADGRFVVFTSDADDLVAGDTVGRDVFLHDRDADGNGIFDETGSGGRSTIRVSVASDGMQASTPSGLGAISGDGNVVLIESLAANLVADDTNAVQDLFRHERVTGVTSRASLAYDGSESASPSTFNFLDLPVARPLSHDGRFVVFGSGATDLVPGDTNAKNDIFVRGVGGATCGNTTIEAGEDCDPPGAPAAACGGDDCSPSCQCNDFTQDGDLDDVVLRVFDTGTDALDTLCPADAVATAAGSAAFLRPESGGAALGCPAGTPVGDGISLNGDGDASDRVVHLWSGSAVENYRCAAGAVALSTTYVAALVDEAAHGVGPLNGDSDVDDKVLATRSATNPPAACSDWTPSGQAAEAIAISGAVVAMLTPESAQGDGPLNGDGDSDDRILQLFDAATGTLVPTGQAAEDSVIGTNLIAFHTLESAQGTDLNADGDLSDSVLQVFDFATPGCLVATPPADCLQNSLLAVTPCRLEACDPRQPYRVSDDSVKFLTFECDQGGSVTSGCAAGGTDLNNDGDAADLVIERFNLRSRERKVIGTVAQLPGAEASSDPLAGDPVEGGGTEVFVSTGRCIEDLLAPCDPSAGGNTCPNGAFCEQSGDVPTVGTCRRDQGVCASSADCPPEIACAPRVIVPASADGDADGAADAADNCPAAANPGQEDLDADGVGDSCDQQTCGNTVRELDEECDGAGDDAACEGVCRSDCYCGCTNFVADPKARVKVVTRKDAGLLVVKLDVDLGSYDDQNVVVRLDDASGLIVKKGLGTLRATSAARKRFKYRFKGDGVTTAVLSDLSPKQPGKFRVRVKAKHWLSAARAADTPVNTRVTIEIGAQCYTHIVTSKVE